MKKIIVVFLDEKNDSNFGRCYGYIWGEELLIGYLGGRVSQNALSHDSKAYLLIKCPFLHNLF
jgi:hypothetical protein